jgi:23S rRNA (adenine2503-C2)-methyltransferase
MRTAPARAGGGKGSGPSYADLPVTSLPLVFDEPKRALPPRHLADLDPAGRRDAVVALGEKAFRAEQLSRHYFAGHLPEQMTDLGAAVRDKLAGDLLPPLLTPVREVETDGGDTVKTLWRGHDGTLVESVLMRYADRTTVCISSQAGCGRACPCCATGQAGLTRNLSTAEITEQVVAAQRTESARGGRVSNVVFMGMGVTESAIFATRAVPSLTCAFAPGQCRTDHSAGEPDGVRRRLLAVHRRVRVAAVNDLQRPRSGRERRCRSTTRGACR